MSLWTAILSIAIIPTIGLAHGGDFEILQRWYGRGVHAYFEGHEARAVQDLSQAIEGGSKDPRVYYFRGLAYLKTGRIDAARADMARGGALETLDVDGAYPVSRSLERIQGAPRQLLERYRRQATMAAFERQQQQRRRRYEAIRRREPDVLRQRVDLQLDEFARPVSQQSVSRVAPPIGPEPAPDGGQGGTAGTAAAAPSPASQPAQQRDPFGDDAGENNKPPRKGTMAPGAFGRVLSRVLGKALPTDRPKGNPSKEPKGHPVPIDQDPFADDIPAVPADEAPAVPADGGGVTDTPTAPAKTKTGPGSANDSSSDDAPASPDPSPSATEGERPAEPAVPGKAPAAENAPFGSDDAAAGSDEDDPFADN